MSRFHMSLAIVVSVFLSIFACINVQAQDQTTSSSTINAQGNQENTVTTTKVRTSADGSTSTKTIETRHTVITSVPAADETISTPTGFISCVQIEAGWHDQVWIPAHKVCKYENSTQGVAWIEGYWRCNKATESGVCVIWEWISGRWTKTFSNY